MAQIDSLLRVLLSNDGDELRVTLGESPRLFRSGQPLRFFFPEVGADMHGHLIGDLLTDERSAELDTRGSTSFQYTSDELGAFHVELRGTGGRRALFRRVGAPPRPKKARNRPPAPESTPAPPQPAPIVAAALSATPAPAPVPRAAHEPRVVEALEELLEYAVEMQASDVHLANGEIPVMRVDGRLDGLGGAEVTLEPLVGPLLSADQLAHVRAGGSADLAIETRSGTRYRVHVYSCDGGLASAFRVLRRRAPSLTSLHHPVDLEWLVDFPHGLVLFCGPTGSGKSTTMAALVQHALKARRGLLVTLEDPIEYTYTRVAGSLVRQREIGRHVPDFPTGLRDALREDPDILLVGEMRDPDSIQLALTAAETGHLVLASLHSRDAPSAVERIVDAYPPERQAQIRTQLSESLRAVVSQRLLPRVGGGRTPAVEILAINRGAAHMIREGKQAQLVTAMQTGAADGMITFDKCISMLVRQGLVPRDAVALES